MDLPGSKLAVTSPAQVVAPVFVNVTPSAVTEDTPARSVASTTTCRESPAAAIDGETVTELTDGGVVSRMMVAVTVSDSLPVSS